MTKQNMETTETTQEETQTELLVSEEEIKELFETNAAERSRRERQMENNVVSPIVLARTLGVRPQMIYNYIRNGKIAAARTNNTQKLYIELPEAMRFSREYLSRKQERANKVEAELNGN